MVSSGSPLISENQVTSGGCEYLNPLPTSIDEPLTGTPAREVYRIVKTANLRLRALAHTEAAQSEMCSCPCQG